MFLFDWDETTHLEYEDGTETPVKELKPFKDFNLKWENWCEKWQSNRQHNTPANKKAFHEWAIDNTKTNTDDKLCDFISNKRPYLHGSIFRVAI